MPAAHVVRARDHQPACALGELLERRVGVHAQARLGRVGDQHLLAGEEAEAAQHLLAHAGGDRLVERLAGGRRVAHRGEPARVDRVDADVGAVGLADGGREHVLQRGRRLDALGEEQDRLAPRERLLLLRQGEDREQRRVPLLLALQGVGEAQRVHDHIGHGDLLADVRGGDRSRPGARLRPGAGSGRRLELVCGAGWPGPRPRPGGPWPPCTGCRPGRWRGGRRGARPRGRCVNCCTRRRLSPIWKTEM